MGEQLTTFPLLLTATVAAVVLIAAVYATRGRMRPNPVLIVLMGGGLSWIFSLAQMIGFGIAEDNPELTRAYIASADITHAPMQRFYWWMVNGVAWLILYRVLGKVELGSWPRRIFALVAVFFCSSLYTIPFVFLNLKLFGQFTPSQAAERALRYSTGLSAVSTSMGVAFIVLEIWIVTRWLASQSQPMQGRRWTEPEMVRAVGLKGVIMSKLQNQSTRLLCASVLLNHGTARQTLLGWLKDKNRAVALELGLDVRLAAQIARFAEKREHRNGWIYFAICSATALLWLFTQSPLPVAVGMIVAAVFWFIQHKKQRDTYAPMFWADRFDPEKVSKYFAARLEPEDLDSLPTPEQNFFVFGGFTPFVGAGYDLGGWSVVIALDKPRSDFGGTGETRSFEIGEVYEAIDNGLEHLAVRNVQKTDAFFARGTDVRGDRDLLPDIFGRPIQTLNPRVAAQYLYLDDEKVRHYRCYRIVDWGGELSLSYYIRCSCRGNTMFVETKRFILTPLDPKYRTVDTLVPMRAQDMIASMMGALIAGPIIAAVSPLWALVRITQKMSEIFSFREDKMRKSMLKNTPLFNYGTQTSLRQSLSSGAYGHYFQKMDGDLYSKLFEHEVLDSLVEFLDAHGIDTSDLKERQTTILNNGVMVQGGDVKAESLAVGAGAKAIKKMQGLVGAPAAATAGRAE